MYLKIAAHSRRYVGRTFQVLVLPELLRGLVRRAELVEDLEEVVPLHFVLRFSEELAT